MTVLRVLVAACVGCAAALVAGDTRAAAPGETIELLPEATERGGQQRSWKGRAWLHPAVLADPERGRPLVVFMHGLNRDRVPHRWMGVRSDPDLRMLVAGLVEAGLMEPAIVAAPTTTSECDMPRLMWPAFNLSRFLALTIRSLEGRATVDRRRVILVGHSGAGCNTRGGMVTAMASEPGLLAVLAVDVCMDVEAAPLFALAEPDTEVVVTWQPVGWPRPFARFEHVFQEISGERHARARRLVERWDINLAAAHHIIVEKSLARWLPRWLPPEAGGSFATPNEKTGRAP
jgi:hypothetical protein